MDFVTPIITIVEKLWDRLIYPQLQYSQDLEEKVQHLGTEMVGLTAVESDVKGKVNIETSNLRTTQDKVDHWLKAVEGVRQQVNRVETEYQDHNRCLKGCLPNCYSRRKLGKETPELIKAIRELKEEASSFNDVALYPEPTATFMTRAESFIGKAANFTFKRICDCLKDEKIASVGVYGMGGAGKTTMVKNVQNFFHDQKEMISFSMIIFATVSESPDLKSVQKSIAYQIGFSLPEDQNEENLSWTLHEALQRRKRLLIILDDLWDPLPLEKVGIPKPNANCKVLLVSRSIDVCRNMETNENIEVETLSSEDAWSLFQKKAGLDVRVLHDSKIEEIAKEVAEECGGLPLALVTVGLALREEDDVKEWEYDLKQLKDSTANIKGMEDRVFRRLEFSFNHLKSEKLRACFLYCSLFSEDHEIKAKELIDHWIWNGFIIQMENKQDEVREGRHLLRELSRVSMLEYDNGSDTVMMHDLMRDMAIRITKHKPCFMVKAGRGLDKPPADHEWLVDTERISLMQNVIERLSGQPTCPRLQTLLLNGNHFLQVIPQSFFDNMCNLRVLDLRETRIETLPKSLLNLENLHALLLDSHMLHNIPSLANLKELRVLHLSNSQVKEMPESLTSLENLLELHLRHCGSLNRLPCFANLRKLRSLDLCGTSIEELPEHFSNLENLTNLNLSRCEKLKRVPSLANLKKMEKLRLTDTCIEEWPEFLFDLECITKLILSGNKKLNMVPSLGKLGNLKKLDLSDSNFKELPESLSDLNNLHSLSLCRCTNLKKVPSLGKVQQLRFLSLAHTDIEELPEGMERLVALETLHLDFTRRLRRFPIGILRQLSLLKDLSTRHSSCLWSLKMDGTMEGRIGITEIAGLTRLTSVRFDCDDILSFSYFTKSMKIERLELGLVKSNNQRTSYDLIVLSIWRLPSFVIENRMDIRELHDMICLSEFLSDLDLMELEAYKIDSCDGIQFLLEGRDNKCSLLPNAIKLDIENLASLESLHKGTIVQGTLASLRYIEVSACPKLKNLFSLRLLQSLQCLNFIHVNDCDMLEELAAGEDVDTGEHIPLPNFQRLGTLPNLRYINVYRCSKLKNLLPLWLLQSLQSLESIRVGDCKMMEELAAGEDVDAGEHIALPKFWRLRLVGLTGLKSICSRVIKCDSLEDIVVEQCPHLKKIPLCIDKLPHNFKGYFEGKKEWWDALDWDDPTNTRLLLQPFFKDKEASQEKESNQEPQKEEPKEESHEKVAAEEKKVEREQ